MDKIIDKKAFWREVLDDLSDQIDPGLYFQLREKSYVDRIEPGKVVIAVLSEAMKHNCEKKYLYKIGRALSDALEHQVQVTFVHGPPRIFVKLPHRLQPTEYRLKALHDVHGDIMTIVNNDDFFRKVSTPLEHGGWGIFPEVLTNACKDYGVIAVQEGLAKVADMPKVENARGFFDAALKRGDFGEKLTRSADNLGLRHDGKKIDETTISTNNKNSN